MSDKKDPLAIPPAERVKLWTDALRSGKHQQGKSFLCESGKHCCLGVLCEVFIEQGGNLPRLNRGTVVKFGGEEEYLPDVVQEWIGLFTSYGDMCCEESLVDLNDNGSTFAHIADVIDSRQNGLFRDGFFEDRKDTQ